MYAPAERDIQNLKKINRAQCLYHRYDQMKWHAKFWGKKQQQIERSSIYRYDQLKGMCKI